MSYRIVHDVMPWIFVVMFIVGIVTAILDLTLAGFTPVIWFLIGVIAILLVICNEVTQLSKHIMEKK
jgi:hypothetical protein